MKKKIRSTLGVAFVILICIVGVFETSFKQARIQTAYKAAQFLREVLLNYDFDGVSVDEQIGIITLYTYVKESDSRSILNKKEVASIELDVDQLSAVDAFKNVRCFCNGLFFATEIGWDGEWSGVYLSTSEVLSDYEEYVVKEMGNGAYWLCDVPDNVLRKF